MTARSSTPQHIPPGERAGPVAPDGQRIVNEPRSTADERATIEERSDRLEEMSREERAQEPSSRFWSSPRAQIGPILALLAGVFTLAIRTWPIVPPQGRGTVGTAWFVAATLIGVFYVVGFFLSSRHWQRARVVLLSAAVLHLLIGFLASVVVDTQDVAAGWQSFAFDAIPAIVAIVAAFLIRPVPDEREIRASDPRESAAHLRR